MSMQSCNRVVYKACACSLKRLCIVIFGNKNQHRNPLSVSCKHVADSESHMTSQDLRNL